MGVLSAYEQVFGAHPSAIILFKRQISYRELDAFVEARRTRTDEGLPKVRPTEIWPLVSHHRFNPHSLFGGDLRQPIEGRVLMMLLAYDGLVISDPTLEIVRLRAEETKEAALHHLLMVTRQLADVEPLILADVLRFESTRPSFASRSRAAVLEGFGVQGFRAFTNFDEARSSLPDLSPAEHSSYVAQADELLGRFGLTAPEWSDVYKAADAVRAVGQSLIHLSWQLAICSEEPSCDLTFTGVQERDLFRNLLADALGDQHSQDHSKSGHFSRVAMGDLPGLDSLELSIADALSMRQDETFEGFRDALQGALDEMDDAFATATQSADQVERRFERRMREESRRLRETAARATFKDRVRVASVPAAVAVVTAAATAAAGPLATGLLTAASSAAAVVWEWLRGRTSDGRVAAIRYSSALGGDTLP